VEGIIHISELDQEGIQHAGEVMKVGQSIQAKIIGTDPSSGRIRLTCRKHFLNWF